MTKLITSGLSETTCIILDLRDVNHFPFSFVVYALLDSMWFFLRYYAKTMERIQAKGKKYAKKEIARLDRMLAEGKLSAETRYTNALAHLVSQSLATTR